MTKYQVLISHLLQYRRGLAKDFFRSLVLFLYSFLKTLYLNPFGGREEFCGHCLNRESRGGRQGLGLAWGSPLFFLFSHLWLPPFLLPLIFPNSPQPTYDTHSPLAPLSSFPWREEGEEAQLPSLGRAALLRFQTWCYLGRQKGACLGAGNGRQKLHISAFVSVSLEISPTRLHRCAEGGTGPRSHQVEAGPASLLAGCCSSLLCRGNSFQGQNCYVEVGVCDREWQAGPQFGVVIPES